MSQDTTSSPKVAQDGSQGPGTASGGIRDRIVELRRVPAGELRANPRNWRRHPTSQAKALRSMLERVGYADALLARETPDGLELVDGHLRAETTPDENVPVLVLDLDQSEADLLLATLDPLAVMAETDQTALADLIQSVEIPDPDLERFIAGLGSRTHGQGEIHGNPIEPPEHPTTQPGDLWTLGRHRLLCGDATSQDDVHRVMAGERAALCLTDPPYAIGWDYRSTDDTTENLETLITGFLSLALSTADVALVTCGQTNLWRYPQPEWTLCWANTGGLSRTPWGFGCWQPILAYGADPYLRAGQGARPDTVTMGGHAPDVAHPAPKPLGLWSWLMERGSIAIGDIVFDPFAGSGTTGIVAEQMGRSARMIEIDPAYCDVIVDRWEQTTGGKAERVSDAS